MLSMGKDEENKNKSNILFNFLHLVLDLQFDIDFQDLILYFHQ
jgi:hypothetical protein